MGMSSKKHQIPDIRFKGFTDAWEQRKLGETVQITMGQSPNGENYTEDPKDHILVQGNADMKNGRVSPRVWTTQVTKKGDPEDIILSVRAPVGDVGKTNYPVVLGRGVAGIKGNAFIFQTLSRMKEIGFWTKYSSGSTFESINSADLKEAVIQIPNIEEQIKIGDFFTKLDDTIALHQRQLDNYKELKKAMLQKIFNQELRFKNDDGNDYPDWREVILEEICLYKSSNISLDSFKEYNGEEIYPLYDANSLVLNIDKYDQENEYVSIIKDGAGVGRIRYCEGKSSVLGTMGYLLPTDTVDIKFLYFRLQIINFLSYVSGSTIPHIYFKDYKKENIGLPCEDEQKKIADVLSALDIKIEISVQKIEALKQQKKGFMQQMFV